MKKTIRDSFILVAYLVLGALGIWIHLIGNQYSFDGRFFVLSFVTIYAFHVLFAVLRDKEIYGGGLVVPVNGRPWVPPFRIAMLIFWGLFAAFLHALNVLPLIL